MNQDKTKRISLRNALFKKDIEMFHNLNQNKIAHAGISSLLSSEKKISYKII